jgi:Type I phosphodiesterase / nucleotide pyrophosphatase
VDGTRFDALSADATPAIWAADVLTPITIDDATPSWSGPCWANIATGVPVTSHNITGNDLTGHRLEAYPDFLTVATRAGHSTLLAVAGWPPLATDEDGGPLFAEASRREFVEASEDHGMAAWDVADETVTSLAISIIEADGPQASFVYLGAVDIAGHLIGAGADYQAAVRAADQRVGRLIAAVATRPDSADWTIVVVTDHGHLDEGGHGGREPEVLTAWAAVSGPGASPVASHLDIAPLVRRCLSLSRQGAALTGGLVEGDRAGVRRVERAGRPGDRDADHGVTGIAPGCAEPAGLIADDEEDGPRQVSIGDVRRAVLVGAHERHVVAPRPDQNAGG